MQAISAASQSSASVATGNISRGSSVSSDFVNEYEEILKYAFVAPKIGIEENLYKEKDTSVKRLVIQNGNSSDSSLVTTSESKESKDSSSVIDPNFVNVPETKIPALYPTRKSKNKEIKFNLPSTIAMDTLLGKKVVFYGCYGLVQRLILFVFDIGYEGRFYMQNVTVIKVW